MGRVTHSAKGVEKRRPGRSHCRNPWSQVRCPETADSHTAGAKHFLDHSLPYKAFAETQTASEQAELEGGTTSPFNRGKTDAWMSYTSTDQGWRTEFWRSPTLLLPSSARLVTLMTYAATDLYPRNTQFLETTHCRQIWQATDSAAGESPVPQCH